MEARRRFMRAFITGGTGFIGSALIPKLLESGHDVYSLERYVTGRYRQVAKTTVTTVFGDLRDSFSVRKLMRQIQPDAVIHLAAISPVVYSYEHPQEVFEVNTLGTINLAEACLREIPHFSHFLFAGTSEEYGIQEKFPIGEDAQLRPNSPYSVSKVAADHYLQYMKEAYDFPVTVLRPFNTYGRRDNTHFVVEQIIVQMLRNSTVQLGDPTAIRDLMYIDDHVNAYLACLDNPKAIGQVFNFCTGHATSIEELFYIVSNLIENFDVEVQWRTLPDRPLDIKKLLGNYDKAKKMLGWQPKCSLLDGLKKTIEFWKMKLEDPQR